MPPSAVCDCLHSSFPISIRRFAPEFWRPRRAGVPEIPVEISCIAEGAFMEWFLRQLLCCAPRHSLYERPA